MVKFECAEVYNMWQAIKGARLSYGSWSDTVPCDQRFRDNAYDIAIGEEDARLIRRLVSGGPSHRKFMRQILVSVDITAPRYWWVQFDTYKVGVVTTSESTMHTLMRRPIAMRDFAFKCYEAVEERIVRELEGIRRIGDFRRLVTLLPQGYLQKRHVTMNYEVILSIIQQRRGHKLSEWGEFIGWACSLPHAGLFFGDAGDAAVFGDGDGGQDSGAGDAVAVDAGEAGV